MNSYIKKISEGDFIVLIHHEEPYTCLEIDFGLKVWTLQFNEKLHGKLKFRIGVVR